MSNSNSKYNKLFSQQINLKMEPLIQSGFVNKINSKKKEDLRFLSATYSAFYLSSISFMRSLKISRRYSWIDLISINNKIEKRVILTFNVKNNSIVELKFEDLTFFDSIYSYLRDFLPENHPAFSTLPIIPTFNLLNIKYQFQYMFLSICHSELYILNETIYSKIHKNLNTKLNFSIDSKDFDLEIIKLLCKSLIYAKGISDLEIGGENFINLWKYSSEIIFNNHQLISFTIFDYNKFEDFQIFLKSLKNSSITSLEFIRITFNEKIFK